MAVATATTLPFIDITNNPTKMLNLLFRKLLISTFLKIVEEKFAFYKTEVQSMVHFFTLSTFLTI